jgi:hypothetical protein
LSNSIGHEPARFNNLAVQECARKAVVEQEFGYPFRAS